MNKVWNNIRDKVYDNVRDNVRNNLKEKSFNIQNLEKAWSLL